MTASIRCHSSWIFPLVVVIICSEFNSFLFIYVTCFVYIWAITTQLGFRKKNRAKIDKQPWENERSKHYLWFVRCMQMIIHFGRCSTCVQKWMKVIALAVFHSLYFLPNVHSLLFSPSSPVRHMNGSKTSTPNKLHKSHDFSAVKLENGNDVYHCVRWG